MPARCLGASRLAERGACLVPVVASVSLVAHHGNRWTNGSASLFCLWTIGFYVPKHFDSQLEEWDYHQNYGHWCYLATDLTLRQFVELQPRGHKYHGLPTIIGLMKTICLDCLNWLRRPKSSVSWKVGGEGRGRLTETTPLMGDWFEGLAGWSSDILNGG